MLNADDELVMKMKSKTNGPVLTFGVQHAADVTAKRNRHVALWLDQAFSLQTPLGRGSGRIADDGRHNLMNALAASAVATALKVRPELIADALRSAKPPKMRGEVLNFAGGFHGG